jgi:hypothetical protein
MSDSGFSIGKLVGNWRVRWPLFALAASALFVLPTVSWATPITIYSDDFSGSSATNLNGQAPDVRPGTETGCS